MDLLIVAVLAVMVVAFAAAFILFIKKINRGPKTARYDVFEVAGNELIVLAGIPVTYSIDAIEKVVFSTKKARRGSSYMGIMRIVKGNGKKSRPFMFDGSAYTKRFVLVSTKQDIEAAIRHLICELEQHGIPCLYLHE